ncbi:MAG: DUF1127 domain-containing protein [Rhodobacteraceae bacterium]|nr:DUF1127 domain-containing protein [Paracoccaceae bacterium]
MTSNAHPTRNAALLPRAIGLMAMVMALVQVAETWSQRRRSRIALARLSPRLLDDIGIADAARDEECRRRAWRS